MYTRLWKNSHPSRYFFNNRIVSAMSPLNVKGSTSTPRQVKLPGQRLRNLATKLLHISPLHSPPPVSPLPAPYPVKVVCISDTHNTQPELPLGDILIHAGDLTETGNVKELQAQLTWLSSQPHRHKIVIAGNHDVALDETFLESNPRWKRRMTGTLHDLDWGSVHYLQDAPLELKIPNESDTKPQPSRKILIYGSPRTPQYGLSAFQYPRDQDIWTDKIPSNTEIVVTHGPPRLHLDARDFYRASCPYLAHEVARVRPKLVVFGHIHVARGKEDVVLDKVQRLYEEIFNEWAGWGALAWMAVCVLCKRLKAMISGRENMIKKEKITTFVNAAVVDGPKNELMHGAIVVDI